MLGTAQCFDSKDEMFRVCQLSSYICCLKALTLKAFTLLWGAAFTAFHLLLYIPFSRTSDSKIHKPTRYFSAEKSKTNKSLHTNLPPLPKNLWSFKQFPYLQMDYQYSSKEAFRLIKLFVPALIAPRVLCTGVEFCMSTSVSSAQHWNDCWFRR